MTHDEFITWAKSHGWLITHQDHPYIGAVRRVTVTSRGVVLGDKERYTRILWHYDGARWVISKRDYLYPDDEWLQPYLEDLRSCWDPAPRPTFEGALV